MSMAGVLLVDDEENILRALKRVFRKENYKIFSTTRPEEALEILRKNEIDALITDQRMPVMTGVELLMRARFIQPDAVRMMLTGYADLKTAEEAINKGEVWRFFLKPWNDEDLKTTVRQALRQAELYRENRRLLSLTRKQNLDLARRGDMLEKKVETQSRQLEETQAQLIHTEKLASMGLMAGGIAHEINNPLGGILTMAQLLLEEMSESSPFRADLEEIEAAALHAKAVVENLLRFSRQDRKAAAGPVKLHDVLEQVNKLLAHSLKIQNIEVIMDVSPELPAVWGDNHKLQQVFLNLLTNASQAMPGGGRITITAERANGDRDVCIKVADNGVGIPDDHIKHIFDPFFTTKPEGEGTGLGLSITYGIIKEHHGDIDVESRPDYGTTLTVRLNRADQYMNGTEESAKPPRAEMEMKL